jgi:glycerol uptake facilitator-like aquaporin
MSTNATATVASPVDEVGPHPAPMSRRLVAEALGTAFLLAVVVGSGIMGKTLFPESDGLALLANAIATGCGLVALILTFGSISGAHFNPVVTLIDASSGGMRWADVPAYIVAQVVGAIGGVLAAHAMFERALLQTSHHVRSGGALLFSEFVATFGLIAVIWSVARRRPDGVPYAVGAYITAAYWFTPSTSFANPAVTIARTMTDTFAGIRPADAPGFTVAQVVGAFAAAGLMRWLLSPGGRR